MTNLILCGGSGTRLWPNTYAKTVRKITPGHNLLQGNSPRKSLFQLTVERNSKVL
jgi:mannose-1-phosphate guanylyltransferase